MSKIKKTVSFYKRYIEAPCQFIVVSCVWLSLLCFILYAMPENTSRSWFIFTGIFIGFLPVFCSFELTIILFISSVGIYFLRKSCHIKELFDNNPWLFDFPSIIISVFILISLLMFLYMVRGSYYKKRSNTCFSRFCGWLSGAKESPGFIFRVGKYSHSYDQRWCRHRVLILELDDMGQLYDKSAIENSLRKISRYKKKVLVVTFVHGWNHNASERKSGNLRSFSSYISRLQKKIRKNGKETIVVGIYIAWQGQRYAQPLQRFMTFFDRSAKSREIGSGDIRIIYSKIDQYIKSNNNISVIHVGHSFGASVLFTALSSSMISNSEYSSECLPNIAIVMLNPAFEGKYYLPIYNILINKNKYIYTPPKKKVYILTSEKDDALNKLFLSFKFSKVLTESFRSNLQKKCLNNAVGKIDEFNTHEFGVPININGRFFVSKVRKNIIKDHNDIWNGNLDKYIISRCP